MTTNHTTKLPSLLPPSGSACVAPPAGTSLTRPVGSHAQGASMYTLDGDTIDLDQFIEANAECLEPFEVDTILAMKVGESYWFGGGAAASFVLARVS